jgi:hypothetical protein
VALKTIRSILAISFIFVLVTAFFPIGQVHALDLYEKTDGLPTLDVFISQVKDGQAGALRGIYIPDILAVPVIQQPAGNNTFVSPRQNIITQFNLASAVGSTGLLAHNYLAGENFSSLKKDQKFSLVYGDGRVLTFVITEVLRYQALEPESTSSRFVSLENNDLLTASELFSKVYARPGDVILQTCISRDNNLSWGRLFVIAEPDRSNP